MAVHYRTQGIFLKKSARGEADELLTIYTKDFGKLRILGRAIRKISSKLRGGADLFYFSEIEFIQGKTHKTLTEAILIERFSSIRKNLQKLRVAYQIAKILDELVIKEEKDRQAWELLNEVFMKLNNYTLVASGYWLVYYYFFWHLVSILGYHPELQKDSFCGEKIDIDLAKILKLILKKDWQTLARLKIEPRHLKLLKNASECYNKEICGTN